MRGRTGASADPDGRLLARFQGGEAAAFADLVERWQGPLLRFSGSLLRSAVAAEDVVQECFLRLIRRPPEIGSDGDLGPWLFRVCRNLCLDAMKTDARENRRRERLSPPAAAPGPADRVEAGELADLVDRELGRLPLREREILLLKVGEGLSYRQIAEVTGLAAGTVGWLIHQALGRLCDRLRAAEALEG
ncbi:MAG: RNA polymerase sigma factor [Planctomycetota bacterium]|nr:MAG: RNA polymerase sigma factor [Planctomycetota bacterium]